MAGSVTYTLELLGQNLNSTLLLTAEWVGDASDGTVPIAPISSDTKERIAGWYITKVSVVNDSPTPTTGYSIVLEDSDGIDLSGGELQDISSSTNQFIYFTEQIDNDGFSFILTGNSIASAQGKLKIFLNR